MKEVVISYTGKLDTNYMEFTGHFTFYCEKWNRKSYLKALDDIKDSLLNEHRFRASTIIFHNIEIFDV